MATWAPLVPFAKERTEINDGTLGLVLLFLGIGSVCSMPVTGALTAKMGCRKVIFASTLVALSVLPFLATVSTVPLLAFCLFIFGGALGTIDVAMNIQAVMVEQDSKRPMMSGFHGIYSLGSFAGAAMVSVLLSFGLSSLITTLFVSTIVLASAFVIRPFLLPYGARETGGPIFALPHGVVLFIGILCFVVFLTEGSMIDWSAVFLIRARNVVPAHAGIGYAVFSITMTVGRLCGNFLVSKLGGSKIILFGALSASAGLLIAVFAPMLSLSVAGFALVGIGCSNIVPVLFSTAGRQTRMPSGLAISAISTVGYAGILAGPALIGFVSHQTSLQTAFVIVAVALIVVATSSRVARE